MAECRKVVRYVDMPLQHIHPNMLQRMRRETSREHIEDLIGRIRNGVPGLVLRTTFIVGFPGETEACFESLLDFIRATRFERLGVFTYSQEAGTLAGRMGHQVDDAVKEARKERAMATQLEVARSLGAAQVGRTLRVLVERPVSEQAGESWDGQSWEHGLIRADAESTTHLQGRWYVARSEGDAPDIDGRVYVRGRVAVGRFTHVRVVNHTDYDLLASPVVGAAGKNRVRG
jgi:ribosomal protein S12 methylthiotransferase